MKTVYPSCISINMRFEKHGSSNFDKDTRRARQLPGPKEPHLSNPELKSYKWKRYTAAIYETWDTQDAFSNRWNFDKSQEKSR